jgi:hypothetical protein
MLEQMVLLEVDRHLFQAYSPQLFCLQKEPEELMVECIQEEEQTGLCAWHADFDELLPSSSKEKTRIQFRHLIRRRE